MSPGGLEVHYRLLTGGVKLPLALAELGLIDEDEFVVDLMIKEVLDWLDHYQGNVQ